MRLHYFLLVVAASFLASIEAFSQDFNDASVPTKHSFDPLPDNKLVTRSLRIHKTTDADTTQSNEERVGGVPVSLPLPPVTMTYKGVFYDAKGTQKMLELWHNMDEKVENVATMLGVYRLSQEASAKHVNRDALAAYMRMAVETKAGQNYAKFGTGFHSKEKTKELLLLWALQDRSSVFVKAMLDISKMPRDQLKYHRNYKAFMTFWHWREKFREKLMMKALANTKTTRA